jgi:hypothetical protein
MSTYELLYVAWSFLFQLILIAHFSLRKWFYHHYIERYGWLVYALGIPAVLISLVLLAGGLAWPFWLAGILHLIWSLFGYIVEYVAKIRWRNPIRWPVFGPYVILYLATIMFYWWPLAQINRVLWYIYAVLFVVSTFLNVSSHRGGNARTSGPPEDRQS